MARRDEEKLLDPCRTWLSGFLEQKHRHATIRILPSTHRKQLRHALNEVGLASEFPECSAWEVKVDVVAAVTRRRSTTLVFVEMKSLPASLRDVGQLLGYCRVCRPTAAYLFSSEGLSGDLYRLLTTYGRTDILRFDKDYIRVGTWDTERNSPNWSTLVPSGDLGVLLDS